MFADTGNETGERNDFSGEQHWGKAKRGVYLIDPDYVRRQVGSPGTLERNTLAVLDQR